MGSTEDQGAMTDRPEDAGMMAPPPQAEHRWLQRMLGEWTYESEVAGPPGQPPMRAKGRESVRPLGDYWVIGEAEGEMPGGSQARWVMTMGFDPRAGRFRGSWVGSMAPQMMLYDGTLSEDGRTLTLESEGPSFTGEGTARYRDTAELAGDDRRIVTSHVQGPDGSWTRFMQAHFRRVG